MSQLIEVAQADDTRPYLALPLAQYFPSIPEVLEYESKWVEHHNGEQLPRVMVLLYYPAMGLFHVMPDDARVPLRVTVFSKANPGAVIAPWELHVGAVIDVLGRATTLAKATHATVTWLDHQARRMYRKKELMEQKLNKYITIPRVWNVVGASKTKLEGAGPSAVFGGTIHLHNLATCVMNIETELSKYT